MSEPVVLGPDEGETLAVGASRARLIATTEATGGGFSISDTTVEPGFPGPPLHRHRRMHDAFYVLEGTLSVRVGEQTVAAGPGSFVCVPPGVVHTFANTSDSPVRFLNVNTPAGWEAYLRELAAELKPGATPDPARIGQIAARHDFEAVGPPA